ncbi:endonuclease/exonuclease/phosphatase family protein [Micromonospora sp. DR5-3]|uniref:endonuclease/exonuclease/phosphatase family protein n=1 Tax=unclassified Micromonospora TaxID=2617518 RepID=UPI0011DA42DD|nr:MULTISPECIES: endonuclease/exonuclease/phosphatase family protein [unclassified Micromonospora]MCW3815742.1 endonuclease/exonuclease/phosphatase family protein [Micromonospora sp. DR5-3]TYC14940.1 endonuclease/exonuclease/phosphatase [Micromonospora sp. MP36]
MTSTLTVMTWNVENLFPAGHKYGPPDRETYDVKIAYLATTIRGLNPDVVALQEVGDPRCAQDLARAVGDGWQVQLADPAAGNHPIRVGVLSPHPVTVEDQVVKLPDAGLPAVPDVDGKTLKRMGRGALQVHVDVGGGLRLLTCHLKSKLLTYPDDRRYPKNEDERARGAGYALLRRAAEAVAVRVQVNKVMTASATNGEPGIPTVLCGDLNDGPDAVTTTLLSGPSDGDINRPDKGDPVRLYNLAPLLPTGRAYSRIYQGRGELIDHILVSRDLRLRVASVDSLVDDIGSITESTDTRRPATVPDHAPVIARFHA